MTLSSISTKFPARRLRELARIGLRISVVGLVTCSILAGGCVSGILSRGSQVQTEEKAEKKPELMKPRIGTESERNRVAPTSPQIQAEAGKPNSAGDDISQESEAPKNRSNKPAKDFSWSDTDRAGKGLQENSPRANSPSRKTDASGPARRETGRGEEPGSSTTDSDALDKPVNPEVPIKRHDHAKYTEHIRNKAVDVVNRESNSDHAVMCKDAITDQWSLVLYYLKEGTYTFVTYLWDEIDEKWQKSFASDKRPLSGWQTHLKFQSSGKECKILKRARR